MKDRTWGELQIPNIYKELEGEFINFDIDKEELICKYPVLPKFFNPMDVVLGGILDSYMDCTMGPLSFLLGELVVTKTFTAKYIKPVNAQSKYVTVKAWRDSVDDSGSIYKAELYLDHDQIASISEGLFVRPKT